VRRREFTALLGGAAVAWPLASDAQQPREPAINIGVLTDMSGLYATLAGAGSVAAAEMAVEDFGGEVFGRKIRVLFGDHDHKVDMASALATRWFNDEHVGAICRHAEFDGSAGEQAGARVGRIPSAFPR
jgi:branched-chain amino acid transport system substrate-binding protein